MTQDTISREEYEQLWESGLFKTQGDLQNFVRQSASTRIALYE